MMAAKERKEREEHPPSPRKDDFGKSSISKGELGTRLSPAWELGGARLYQGDVLEVLAGMADASVNCVVTSPPYWGLRDYGVAGQIGLESSLGEYIERMVAVFREVRRVLRRDGTCWVNMGDCYNTATNKGRRYSETKNKNHGYWAKEHDDVRINVEDLKPKDLVGLAWRVAFALQADGWWLRSDIIWHKPNPMPESVQDRPTRAHEYIFLLTKSQRYWYDHEAIKEPGAADTIPRYKRGRSENHKWADGGPGNQSCAKSLAHMVPKEEDEPGLFGEEHGHTRTDTDEEHGRDAHALLNGNRKDKRRGHSRRHAGFNDRWDAMSKEEQCGVMRNKRSVWTQPTCPYPGAHFATYPPALVRPCVLAGCPEGGIVLDPFAGTSATGEAALKAGRRYVGIELNPASIALSVERLTEVVEGAALLNGV